MTDAAMELDKVQRRIDGLARGLAQTRAIAVALAVVALAESAWIVVGAVRPRRELILADGDATLALSPTRLELTIGKASLAMNAASIEIRDDDRGSMAELTPAFVGVRTGGKASAMLSAFPSGGRLRVDTPRGGAIDLTAGTDYSELTVDLPPGNVVEVKANKTGASIEGNGHARFGLGDTPRAAVIK